MASLEVEQFGKGCIPVPPEKKAKHFVFSASAPNVNWTVPYNVENGFTLPQFNQKSSNSCTAQGTCYYCMALDEIDNKNPQEESRRYIYSQTFLPPSGGAYINTAMSIPLKGSASEQTVPEGDSLETTMRDTSLNAGASIIARTEKYAFIPQSHDIDALAGIVERQGGFITGFQGSNDMFDAKGVASIPTNPTWSHCVWVCGHLTLLDGRKALKFKNSWGTWGDNGYGYFPEEFVKSGPLFDAYVYADIIDIKKPMFELHTADGHRVYAVLNGFRFWVLDPTTEQNGASKLWNLPVNNDPSVLNLPYGGTLFVSNTDDPK